MHSADTWPEQAPNSLGTEASRPDDARSETVAPNAWTPFEHVTIGGQRVVTASRAVLAEAMVADCRAAHAGELRPRLVFAANAQGISLGETDPEYRAAVDQADVIHADGGSVVLLSRLLGGPPIAERSCTTDMFHDLAQAAVANGLSFYLLGAEERVNAECARRMQALYPGLNIVGRRHGFFSPEEEEAVIAEINRLRPDVLWVGLGKPREQVLSVRWRDRLRCGWLVTCGGCYNYVTGDYPRAPLWMQRMSLEWLHRMATNRKLVWRYLTTNPHALWVALRR